MLTSEEARTNPSQVVCENKLAVAGYGCARSGGGAGGGQEQARARERLRGIARSRDFFFTRTRGLQCVAPVRVPGQLFTFPAAFEFLMPRSTEGSVDGLASGQSDPALALEAPIRLIERRTRTSLPFIPSYRYHQYHLLNASGALNDSPPPPVVIAPHIESLSARLRNDIGRR